MWEGCFELPNHHFIQTIHQTFPQDSRQIFTMSPIPTKPLGANGPLVPRLGLGLMGLSIELGEPAPDEERFKFLDRALELGETFWDTANVYVIYLWIPLLCKKFI